MVGSNINHFPVIRSWEASSMSDTPSISYFYFVQSQAHYFYNFYYKSLLCAGACGVDSTHMHGGHTGKPGARTRWAQWGALTPHILLGIPGGNARASLLVLPVVSLQGIISKLLGASCCSVPLIGTVGWLPPSLSTPFDLNICVGMAITKLSVIANQVINCHIFPTSMLCPRLCRG